MVIDVQLYEKTVQDLERALNQSRNKEFNDMFDALNKLKDPDFARVMIMNASGNEFRSRQHQYEENFNVLLKSVDGCALSNDPNDRKRLIAEVFAWEQCKNDATYQEKIKNEGLYMPNTILKNQLIELLNATLNDIERLVASKESFGDVANVESMTSKYKDLCNNVVERLNGLIVRAGSVSIPDTEDARKAIEAIRKDVGNIRGWLANGSAQKFYIDRALDGIDGKIGQLYKTANGRLLSNRAGEISKFKAIGINPSFKDIDEADELAAAQFVFDMVHYQQNFFEEKEEELRSYTRTVDIMQDPQLMQMKQRLVELNHAIQHTNQTSPIYAGHVNEYNNLYRRYQQRMERLRNQYIQHVQSNENAMRIGDFLEKFKEICDELVDMTMGSYKERCKAIIRHGFVNLNDKYDELIKVLRSGTPREVDDFIADLNASLIALRKEIQSDVITEVVAAPVYAEDFSYDRQPINVIGTLDSLGIIEEEEDQPIRDQEHVAPIPQTHAMEGASQIPDDPTVVRINNDNVGRVAEIEKIKNSLKNGDN